MHAVGSDQSGRWLSAGGVAGIASGHRIRYKLHTSGRVLSGQVRQLLLLSGISMTTHRLATQLCHQILRHRELRHHTNTNTYSVHSLLCM